MQTCKREIHSNYKFSLQGRHSHYTRIKHSLIDAILEASILVGDGALGYAFSRTGGNEWETRFVGFYEKGY